MPVKLTLKCRRQAMECELYKVVTWLEYQELVDCEGWEDHSHPVLDDKGIDKFGSCAYFVEKSWLDSLKIPDHDLQD